jgi:hypothetical protein
MATESTKTATTEIPEMAETVRGQIIDGVHQTHRFTMEAAEAIAKTTSSLPIPELPTIPGVISVEAATKFTFDFAAELLNAQRDFALEFTKLFAVKA